jgi:hypothetical protein
MAGFEEVGANRGVDSKKPGMEWMMVPLGGTNLVCLSEGLGYSVAESAGRSRLTITEIPAKGVWGAIGSFLRPDSRVFRIGSHARGETALEGKKGTLTVPLKISVHPRRSFKVAFFFLQDKDAAGKVKARTAFTPSDADGWIEGLNEVFGPQANIWFEKAKSAFLPLEDLSVSIGAPNDLRKLADTQKMSGAPIGIFIAGSKIESLDGVYPLGFFDVATNIIVVKDQFVTDPWAGMPAPMLKTIAHEIGHFMNYAHGHGEGHDYYTKSGYSSDILNTLSGGDIKISQQRVLDWNPW